ncbi:MAG: Ig-like domain-containing protein [Clostridia bacterium]|nr:Ig-like domain-containing protein [Clostridia bacterium]
MKKVISLLLSVVIAFSVITPAIPGLDFADIKAEAASGSGSAYATLFTTSDLQVNDYYKQVETMISYAVDDGYSAPDALLFGGDFQTSSNAEESITHHMDNMERLFNKFFPYYHTDNLVFIKGNHDARDERHYETGLYEFDNFMVYVINEDDYRAGNLNDAKTASENLKIAMDRLLTSGNDKPVFVMTHVPFHHNSRGEYSQSAYGRYLFEVLNDYGNYMDIIFLFGHNHSGAFDDYIGGSVNYLGVGDTIYISSYDGKNNLNYGAEHYTSETLTFTYANYGYGGYSNNTEGTITDTVHDIGAVKSTKIETMGVFDIYEDKITLSRYTLEGKYNEIKTINRKTPSAADGSCSEPYVNVAGYGEAFVGTATGAVANATGFSENATYTWKSSNTNIAKVNGTSSVCQISYVGEGTATITVTVKEGSQTASASYDVKVSGNTVGAHAVSTSVLMGFSDVTGQTLEYYNIDFPYSISLSGYYTAAKSVSNEKWTTSAASVATVNNGLVTFVGNGNATITYSVDIVDANGTKKTYNSSVTFIVSNGDKFVASDEIIGYKNNYYPVEILSPGNRYVLYSPRTNYTESSAASSIAISGEKTTNGSYGALKGVSVTPVNNVITTDNELIVWECIKSDSSGLYYLKNLSTGEYFVTRYSNPTKLFTTTATLSEYSIESYQFKVFRYATDVIDGGVQVLMANNTNAYVRNDGSKFYSSSSPAVVIPYQAETILAEPETEAHIEMGGDYVEDSTQTVYKVTDATSIRLYGEHKNYGGNVVETWSSSDTSVATISADGTVDFTGTSGKTTITYTIKSDNVPAKSLTFTLVSKNGREATRTFRYVENIQTDRPYIFVNKSSLTPGDGFALSTSKISKTAMLPADIEIKQNEIHDYLYVEIPASSSPEYVWTTGGLDTSFVYITTEKSIQYTWWNDLNNDGIKDFTEGSGEITYSNGYLEGVGEIAGVNNMMPTSEYLGAEITGYGEWGVTGSLYTLPLAEADLNNLAPHEFIYTGDELYNKHIADVSSKYGSYTGNTAVGYHSSGYYGIGGVGSSYSRVYAFEEVFPDPTAVILSNYEYVGKEVTRDEVCPHQTEQLMAEAQNFPDGTKTYKWSSSNTDVATIDANGKITYTGKAGKTTITLEITNTSDVSENNISDTQTVEITVNPSQIDTSNDKYKFYLTDKFEDGKEYVLAHVNTEQSDAAKNDGLSYTISTERYNDNLAKGEVNPIVAGSPDYIENPTETSIWTATAAGEDGYFYLTDASGNYLAIQYDSGDYDVVRSFSSMEGATNSQGTAISADSFLIKTDGEYLYSKSSGTRGVLFNYGSSAGSTKRFSVGSGKSTFKLFGRTPLDVDIYYKTESLVPGYSYVLAHTPDSGITYTVSSNEYAGSDGNYVKADLGHVIKSGDPSYIEDPIESSIWKAVESGESGYVYLVDQNGHYLALDYTKPRTLSSFASIDSATNNNGDPIDPDCFLFYYNNGYIQSKGSGSGGISFNLGTTTPRFQVSSTMAKFEIFSKKTTQATYYLTDTLTEGMQYIIANSNVAGSAYIASSNMYTNNITPRLKEGTVSVSGSSVYIENPENALVLTCVKSEKNGYYYLVDSNGKYLTLNALRNQDANGDRIGTDTAVVAMAELDEYERIYSQLRYRVSSTSGTFVLQNAGGTTENSDGTSTIKAGYLTFYYSGTSNPRLTLSMWAPKEESVYLYALKDEEPAEAADPQTQIRINGATSSKDITNQLYNRYFIENGDSERLLRYVKDVNAGYTYEWSSSDTSIATIDNEGLVTYTGKEGYVVISLKVTGTDINGIPYTETVITTLQVFDGPFELSSNDYPEYPYEGSIRVNKTASNIVNGYKFQETGVTEIELGATGVPVTRPVDVIVIFDHSTSMNDNKKLQDAMEKTQEFALRVLETNPNNRIAIVAFDSMGSRYKSAISTEVLNTLNESEAGVITGDGTIENAFVAAGDEAALIESIKSLSTNNQGNTNYDYGLKKAYDILKHAKDDGSPNDRIVVFMSDGEPNQFNGVQIDSSTAESNAIREAWLTGDKQFFIDNGYLNADGSVKDEYPAFALFNEDGDNWYAKALKTPTGEPSNLPAFDYYAPYQTGLGAKIFSIGYHTKDTFGALSKMASTPADYFNDIGSELSAAFDKIIFQVFYAASDAVVTDKMGAQFDVQFAPAVTIQGTTYTFSPSFEVGAWTLDNQGNRVAYNVIEKITFATNDNGDLTSATSTLTGDAFDEAASTVEGQYVSYNLLTETFTWNIGDINRNEITLKYYASLTGAAKGEREAGIYNTNESAKLSYTNYRGTKNCSKFFPVPTLGWNQAAVSYEFYLVDENGQPIGLTGSVVPFAERVIIGREQTKALLLNEKGEVSSSLIAESVLPEGYKLFNPDAVYNISVSSAADGSSGSASISDDTLTTYFRNGSYYINVNGEVPDVTSYYNTAVSFAVKVSEGLVPDTIVIDYGLPVNINVLGNDYVVDGGEITGVAKTVNTTDLNNIGHTSSKLASGGKTDVQMTYGNVTVSEPDIYNPYGQYITYTPTRTDMNTEDVFYYEYFAGGKYYYAQVVVIPATNIYYEESFMNFVDGNGYKWEDVGTTLEEKFQAEDRPGNFAFDDFDADNAYGYDNAYADNYTYSLGSAKMTTVDQDSAGKEPKATFTFAGTGFNLYSVTNSDTGMIQVTIYKAGTTTIVKNFLVDTYYGYTGEGDSLAPAPVEDGIYQVPVLSRSDLDYGTYDVVIKPLYSRAFDPNYADGAGEYSIYVDSVRIFNPAGVDGNVSDAVGDAYLKDGEYAPEFKEIRDIVISAEDFSNNVTSLGYNGAIFLDGKTDAGLATYKAQGPKNELYLAPNQAVSFMVSSETADTLASLQLGMKVVSGGATAKVVVMNTSEKSPNYFELNSAHEMFRDIDSAIVWNQEKITYGDDNVYETLHPIVIANVSDTEVISLTSLKWAYTSAPDAGESAMSFMVNEETPMMATFALRRAMAVAEPYNEENVTIEWSDTSFVEGKEATLTVTTLPEVVRVTVDGIDITDCEINEDGNKVWTYTFTVVQTGENAYDVVLYDRNGECGDAIKTETIFVEEAPEEIIPDAPETEEPSDDNTGNGADEDDSADNGDNGMSIFSKIIEFIKKIINFFRRVFA